MAVPKSAPLIKDVKALKELLLWCKAEGVQSIELGGVKAQFSPAALAGPDMVAAPDVRTLEQKQLDSKKEEEDVLFWSVK